MNKREHYDLKQLLSKQRNILNHFANVTDFKLYLNTILYGDSYYFLADRSYSTDMYDHFLKSEQVSTTSQHSFYVFMKLR
jgi:hypothetical protein